MFNLRVSGIVAGIACILSFLICLFSQTSMPMLLVRPLIFAVVFFIIANFIYFLINHFLPELLDEGALNGMNEDPGFTPGSRINITEGDSPAFPMDYSQRAGQGDVPENGFMGAQPDESDDGLGNVSDLLQKRRASAVSGEVTSAGMDQDAQIGYTKPGDLEEIPLSQGAASFEADAFPAAAQKTSAANGDQSGSVDILPDLDSMAGAFLPASGGEESNTMEYSVSSSAPKAPSRKKDPAWTGDFNAKDMAAGLRTIISKEKEG